MTAEVVVLNREAVAIAADSAVTIRDPDKIYHTANKLFQLSAIEPIAVMVYGSAAFGPIPWETAVKEYRRHLNTRTFATVEEYARHFIERLSLLVSHYPVRMQLDLIRRLAQVELSDVYDRQQQIVREWEEDDQDLDDYDKRRILMELMKDRIEALQMEPCIDQISASTAGIQIRSAIPDWIQFLEHTFVGFELDSSLTRRARALVRTSLRSVSSGPWSSGVVIVGFGADQLFPAFSHYVVDGVVAGHPRARHLDSGEIEADRPAHILAFAQPDMVQTFMNGLHPMYPEALRSLVAHTLELLISRVSEQLKDVLTADQLESHTSDMDEIRSSIVNEFEENLTGLLKTTHSDPIMSIVSMLPKEELAEMAETLVSLTSFKRRMTPDAETVGGPIDVAVISRGDGLVWVKRKHYFDKDLNLRYFSRERKLYGTSIFQENSDDH